MSSKRLSPRDWLDAGFRALATRGPGALRAEALARDLSTTKGSFYWHFKDLPDYHTALIATWEAQAAADLTTALASRAPLAARLRQLGQSAAARDSVEPAMRTWARSDATAAAALSEIDRLRLDALGALLRDCGVSNPELARAIYAAGIGMEELSSRDSQSNDSAMGTLVDLVLALR